MPVTEPSNTSHAEEVCLDAEAWATELEAWVRIRPTAAEASDVKSLAAMLRAIVKSVQLSIIADEDPADREFLVEELEQAIATASSLADGSHRLGPLPAEESEDESQSAPPSLTDGIKTKPPPKPRATELIARARTLSRQGISDLPIPPAARPTRRDIRKP